MTTKTTIVGIAGLLAALLATGTAAAQARRFDADYQRYGGGYDQGDKGNDWFFDFLDENDRQDRDAEVYGRVLAIKQVRFSGSSERHLVALINTYTPHFNLVVDLGPERQARRLNLRPYGDRLWVRGDSIIIDGRQVLMADSARTEQRRIDIQRFRRGQFDDHRDHDQRRRENVDRGFDSY